MAKDILDTFEPKERPKSELSTWMGKKRRAISKYAGRRYVRAKTRFEIEPFPLNEKSSDYDISKSKGRSRRRKGKVGYRIYEPDGRGALNNLGRQIVEAKGIDKFRMMSAKENLWYW